MSSDKDRRKLVDWYTVSTESIKGWVFVVVLLVLAVIGVLGYRFLDRMVLEKEVARVIQEAEDLLRTVRSEGAIFSQSGVSTSCPWALARRLVQVT